MWLSFESTKYYPKKSPRATARVRNLKEKGLLCPARGLGLGLEDAFRVEYLLDEAYKLRSVMLQVLRVPLRWAYCPEAQ